MKSFFTMLSIELFKIKKSTMLKIVTLLFTLIPLTAAFFIFLLQHPHLMDSAGLIGQKAHIVGDSTAESYFHIQAQMIAVGGIIAYGFVMSWVFGREYADRTITDLLTLPYPRFLIIFAKFSAAFLVNFIITLYIIIIGIVFGYLLHLESFTISLIIAYVPFLLTVSMLTNLLSAPVAFFASIGKGYLSPLGFIIIILITSQLITAIGFGPYFPWAIPALYSGMTGEFVSFSLLSVTIVIITIIFGMFSTLLFYLFKDQP